MARYDNPSPHAVGVLGSPDKGALMPHDTSNLRHRKRIRTKQMVQREALRLFATKGYDQTTVDDIAHAAAMSSRTFFRYFPAKEDVVLWDEYDEDPIRQLGPTPPGADPLGHLILRAREMLASLYERDPELLLTRIRLSFAVPEVRARFFNQQMELIGPYFAELARIIGADPDDVKLPVTLGALYSAMIIAVERWQRNDGRDNLLSLFDDAIAALADGTADLRDAVEAARASRR
jgi:AcrR family transcriptional regulator